MTSVGPVGLHPRATDAHSTHCRGSAEGAQQLADPVEAQRRLARTGERRKGQGMAREESVTPPQDKAAAG